MTPVEAENDPVQIALAHAGRRTEHPEPEGGEAGADETNNRAQQSQEEEDGAVKLNPWLVIAGLIGWLIVIFL